jgi:hypothetical protein
MICPSFYLSLIKSIFSHLLDSGYMDTTSNHASGDTVDNFCKHSTSNVSNISIGLPNHTTAFGPYLFFSEAKVEIFIIE